MCLAAHALIALAISTSPATTSTPAAADLAAVGRPWLDATLPIPERVSMLLKAMTTEEKVNQTLNDFCTPGRKQPRPSDPAGAVAMVCSDADIASEGMRYLFKFCGGKNASECAAARNRISAAANRSRLGIPLSWAEETLHGSMYSPQYPMPINMGSTWNETIVTAIGAQTAAVARAVGINIGLSPVVNMYPDPRFGRLQEGFSEDPYLTSQMGVAAVRGLQGDNHDPLSHLEQDKLSCVVKHYLAYGHAEQGGIDGGPATLDEQTLRERYLPPWKALVERGMLRGIMASQSAVNHIPMHCHKRLITGVLRRELNASNVFVHSDGGCVIGCIFEPYRMASSQAGAAKLAIGAGVDMDFAGCSYTWLGEEIAAGRIPMSDLDRAVSNILFVKFATGLFDTEVDVSPKVYEQLDMAAMEDTAREAAEQSITLLVNQQKEGEAAPALPLPTDWAGIKSVLLAGPLTDDSNSMQGGYSHVGPSRKPAAAADHGNDGHGEYRVGADGDGSAVTVLKALQAASAAHGFDLIHNASAIGSGGSVTSNCVECIDAAADAAERADVTILVLGDSDRTCGEMQDRSSLELLGGQPELLRRVSAVAKKTIVVLLGGRPLTFNSGLCTRLPTAYAEQQQQDAAAPAVSSSFPWDPNESVGAVCANPSLLTNVSALFMAWRPGDQGGPALLNLITGKANPSGRLPVAWPRSVGGIGVQSPYLQQYQLHNAEAYQDAPNKPLFPFGYGLSYSNFSLSTPVLSKQRCNANDTIQASVTVAELSGKTGGATVVQLYFAQEFAPVIRYVTQLLRYKKVYVPAGGSVKVVFDVRIRDMQFWNDQEEGYLSGGDGGDDDASTTSLPAATRGWSLGEGGNFTLSARFDASDTTGHHAVDPTVATVFVEV
jgi:beta-glucosidase